MEETAFIGKIKSALARYVSREAPSFKPAGMRPVMSGASLEERIDRFKAEAAEFQGYRVDRVKDWKEAGEWVRGMLKERGARRITLAGKNLDPQNPAWKGWDIASDRGTMEKAEWGVVQADYGIAETASAVLAATKDKPRAASLLPPSCCFVLPVTSLLGSMEDLLERLERSHGQGDLPSGVTVVTGPSRTADIELSLTVGVHGPGEVCVVLVG